jgi:hypothetical protein
MNDQCHVSRLDFKPMTSGHISKAEAMICGESLGYIYKRFLVYHKCNFGMLDIADRRCRPQEYLAKA